MATKRTVMVHLAMKDVPLAKSIRKVLGTLTSVTFVEGEGADAADLVIFTEARDVERVYDKEKAYVFLRMPGVAMPALPKNCTIVKPTECVVEIVKIIGDVSKKLGLVSEPTVTGAVVEAQIRPDALRILVIDDTPKNIASAKAGLIGHHLTTVTGYEDAMNILGSEKFDVILTDLHLPMSSKGMGDKFRLGELVPYGILLIIEAAQQGAKHVAVVTDLSHHDDPFSAAFDHFSQFSVRISGAWERMMHAPMNADGSKDWATALDMLLKGKF